MTRQEPVPKKHRRLYWLLLAPLLCAFPLQPTPSVSLAADPQAVKAPNPTSATAAPIAKVDGPETWLIGSVPEFRCASSNPKFRKWKVSPKPDSMKFYEDGKVLVIGSSIPQDFTVLLIVSNENGLDFEEFETRAMAAVNTEPVSPLSSVVPNARMDKVRFEELVGSDDTAGLCYRWAADKLKSQAPEAEAGIVAAAFRNAKKKVDSRSIKTPEEMTRFAFNEAHEKLGDESFSAWVQTNPELTDERPKFFDVFKIHLDDLTSSGKLDTMGKWSEHFMRAAQGLEKFAKE